MFTMNQEVRSGAQGRAVGTRVRVRSIFIGSLKTTVHDLRMGVDEEKEGLTKQNKYIKLFMIQSSTGLDGRDVHFPFFL